MSGYFQGVSVFGFLDATGQFGPAVLRQAASPALKAVFLALSSPQTSTVSHGYSLAQVVIVLVVVTSNVGGDSIRVLFNVCEVVVGGCLLKHLPVSGFKYSRGSLWPHTYLLQNRFGDCL